MCDDVAIKRLEKIRYTALGVQIFFTGFSLLLYFFDVIPLWFNLFIIFFTCFCFLVLNYFIQIEIVKILRFNRKVRVRRNV